MTNDTIVVVKVGEAKREAYGKGFDRFYGMETPSDPEDFDISPYYDSAAYSNHVLPALRRIAGYDDNGTGTFTVERPVALIEVYEEDDSHVEAQKVSSEELFDELHSEWLDGVYDAVHESE
jgi:hypothetical protein